jgi:hypothetical protein
VEVVGGEDSGQDGVKSLLEGFGTLTPRLRVLEKPHFSRKRRARNGAPITRLVRINEWKWWEEKIRDKTG